MTHEVQEEMRQSPLSENTNSRSNTTEFKILLTIIPENKQNLTAGLSP